MMAAAEHHPGIIYIVNANRKHFGTVIRKIDEMAMTMTAGEFKDQIFFL